MKCVIIFCYLECTIFQRLTLRFPSSPLEFFLNGCVSSIAKVSFSVFVGFRTCGRQRWMTWFDDMPHTVWHKLWPRLHMMCSHTKQICAKCLHTKSMQRHEFVLGDAYLPHIIHISSTVLQVCAAKSCPVILGFTDIVTIIVTGIFPNYRVCL